MHNPELDCHQRIKHYNRTAVLPIDTEIVDLPDTQPVRGSESKQHIPGASVSDANPQPEEITQDQCFLFGFRPM